MELTNVPHHPTPIPDGTSFVFGTRFFCQIYNYIFCHFDNFPQNHTSPCRTVSTQS